MITELGAAGLAAGVGVQLLNNAMADEKARESFGRQRILQNDQNRYNTANVQSQAGREAQGYRAAGFNPALMMEGGTQAAPTVSQGNADMAQTFPLNISDMLSIAQLKNIEAQTENVQADTEKKKTEVPNITADTDLKVAQKLYTDASTDVQKEKAEEIGNINKTFKDQNATLEVNGPAMMDAYREKLKEQGVWDKMLPKTRNTIDGLADGEIPLTVGAMKALNDIIDQEGKLSDTDTKLVKNALANTVIHGQLSDKTVLEAMSKMPWYEAELKRVGKDKILADIDKVRKEIQKIGNYDYTDEKGVKHEAKGELAILELEKKYKEMLNKSFESGDLDYLKSQGEYGKWTEKYAEDLLMKILPTIVGGTAIGRGVSAGQKTTIDPINQKGSGTIHKEGLGPFQEKAKNHPGWIGGGVNGGGVDNFKF